MCTQTHSHTHTHNLSFSHYICIHIIYAYTHSQDDEDALQDLLASELSSDEEVSPPKQDLLAQATKMAQG
jgi:hypothetical protein